MQLLPDMTNAETVQRLKEKDDAVFTRVYERSYRMVYLQAIKILGDRDEAENVAQDVFITVFNSIDKLKDPEALRSWIGGIAVRLSLNRKTKLASSRELAMEDETMFAIMDSNGENASPELELCEQETGAILGELIDQLPEEQRISVMLFYYDECAVKEIARIMNCAEGTVKSRLKYARSSLEKLICEREERDSIRLHSFSPALLFLALFQQESSLELAPGQMERGLAAVKGLMRLATADTVAAGAGAGAAAAETPVGVGTVAAAKTAGETGAAAILTNKAALGVAGLLLAGAVTGGCLLASPEAEQPEEPAPVVETVVETAVEPEQETATPEEMYEEIIRMVNELRASHGSPPVEMMEELMTAAAIRVEERRTTGFTCVRPDGTFFTTAIPIPGFERGRPDFLYGASETFAEGYSTAAEVFDYWLEDDLENSKMRSWDNEYIGLAYAPADENGGPYWVMLFLWIGDPI